MDEVVLGIVCRRGKVLLVKRQRDDDFVWSLPGGKIEAGETKEYAIIREIREESGVDCVAVKEIGRRIHPTTGRSLSYWECRYHSGVLYPRVKTIEEVAWFTREEALERLGTSLFDPAKDFLTSCSVDKGI